MEERKITVVSTATQSKKVISTNAETLRDLKTALDEALSKKLPFTSVTVPVWVPFIITLAPTISY